MDICEAKQGPNKGTKTWAEYDHQKHRTLNILLCAATPHELHGWHTQGDVYADAQDVLNNPTEHRLRAVATGVGVASTAMRLALLAPAYDLVVNIGLAGAYNPQLVLGDVVRVAHDALADYGIDDNGQFVPLHLSGLSAYAPAPIELRSPLCPHLPAVRAITVSTASGSSAIIGSNTTLWHPDIETMEGAAVALVCQHTNVKLLCLRSISNRVEPRNPSAWNIALALSNLYRETTLMLSNLPPTL